MTAEIHAVRCMRARFNQAKRAATAMLTLMDSDPEDLTGEQMAYLRSTANEITQCVSEFNAYRNVALQSKKKS